MKAGNRSRRNYSSAVKWIPLWVALINAVAQIVASVIAHL
jgi:hypothetical protein